MAGGSKRTSGGKKRSFRSAMSTLTKRQSPRKTTTPPQSAPTKGNLKSARTGLKSLRGLKTRLR